MTTEHKRRHDDTPSEEPTRDTSVSASLNRILTHAEGHGEAYTGAVDDCAAVRDALDIGTLAVQPDPKA